MSTTTPGLRPTAHQMLNKVPEVTLWFWIIKILCTTVGESFADYINVTLGFGLVPTSILFTATFIAILTVQMRLRQYVPAVYWATVVVVSVTGTLYTDILTDQAAVPLWISTAVFSSLLAGVFGIWYARERTLSIHSIVTTPREAFYWLAVLVTFALGTATGDWTLELTGWGPGTSILLPLSLIAIVTGLWKYGANPVLAFWLAYILTRPLGANIGDFLALPSSERGLGLGTLGTSLLFLAAILATVVYLTISRADVIATKDGEHDEDGEDVESPVDRTRERVSLVAFVAVALATVGLLTYTNNQPHQSALSEGAAPSCSSNATLSPDEAAQRAAIAFPTDDLSTFRTITQDTLVLVQSGDQKAAAARVTDLETAWDDAQARLSSADCVVWTYVDQEIDATLTSVRAGGSDPAFETTALEALASTLG